MKIGVPSGIGDISWLISKLVNSEEWKRGEIEIVIADGWPWRAQPYLDMLGVRSEYGNFRFEDIISFSQVHMSKKVKFPNITWEEIRETKAGVYYIQPNWFLESGRELASYIPDLETNYHYALNLPDILDKKVFGENLVEKLSNNGKWIGISCASYRGSVSWKTWNLNHWLALADYLISDGYKLCLLGGKWDDLTDSLADQLPRENVLNLVGKTDFGEACSVHKLLPFYIGFSSGLGIIRTVLDLPTLMLWPCNESINQQALSMSWADPKDIESKKYIARAYMEPRVIFNVFKTQSEIFKEME